MKAANKLNYSCSELLGKIGVHKRTFNDWKRENYSIPLRIFNEICRITKIKLPAGIEIRQPFWSTQKAGKIAGRAVYQRYGRVGGDPEYRKKQWHEWWEKKGKFHQNQYFIAKKINVPLKDAKLAEFVRIVMGDGGITNHQVIVTLSRKNDKPYSIFLINLIKKLFNIEPSVYLRKNQSVICIIISRKHLVYFCESIVLKVGNKLKQGLDIPRWIKEKENFEISCVRGLVDADGCVFNECHNIKGKKYCYPRLAFISYSKKLCTSVLKILKKLGFAPKIRNSRNVQLENKKDIIRYFQLIGTNNLHHKKRLELFMEG